MDKKFIEDNQLSESINHFQHLAGYKHPKQSLKKLYEYTFITKRPVNEEGEENDEPQQVPQGEGVPQNPQGNMPQNNVPADTNAMANPQQGDMPQDGMQMAQDDMQTAQEMPQGDMGADMEQGMMPDNGDTNTEMPPVEDDGIETQEMEPDDEVIDVDDLTQSQEATEYKIDGVDDRLSQLYAVVQKFSDKLDKNAESIQALKTEFEKRNPTEEERLNIRSQSSYPYCETPKGYWEEKMKKNPHYDVMYNNDVAPNDEQKEFNITRGDISGLDMKSISDSLDAEQNLKNYIGF